MKLKFKDTLRACSRGRAESRNNTPSVSKTEPQQSDGFINTQIEFFPNTPLRSCTDSDSGTSQSTEADYPAHPRYRDNSKKSGGRSRRDRGGDSAMGSYNSTSYPSSRRTSAGRTPPRRRHIIPDSSGSDVQEAPTHVFIRSQDTVISKSQRETSTISIVPPRHGAPSCSRPVINTFRATKLPSTLVLTSALEIDSVGSTVSPSSSSVFSLNDHDDHILEPQNLHKSWEDFSLEPPDSISYQHYPNTQLILPPPPSGDDEKGYNEDSRIHEQSFEMSWMDGFFEP